MKRAGDRIQNSGDRRQHIEVKSEEERGTMDNGRQKTEVRRQEIKEQVPGVRFQVSEAGHPVLMDSLLIDRRLPID